MNSKNSVKLISYSGLSWKILKRVQRSRDRWNHLKLSIHGDVYSEVAELVRYSGWSLVEEATVSSRQRVMYRLRWPCCDSRAGGERGAERGAGVARPRAGCSRSGGQRRWWRRRPRRQRPGDDGATRRARRARSSNSIHDYGYTWRTHQGPQRAQRLGLRQISHRFTRLGNPYSVHK